MSAMSSLSFAVVALHGAGERVGIIRGITTYPLKGARGQPLDSCSLFVGKSTPRDREYALLRHEHIATRWASAEGGGASDASAAHADAILATGEGKDPAHHSNKHLFHQLITDPSLADFGVELEGEHGISILDHDTGRVLARADDVRIDADRRLVESLFAESLETASSDTPPLLVSAAGRSFANVGGRETEHVLHLNCTPTIRAVREALLGDDVDDEHAESLDAFALRFRPNLRIDDPGDGSLRAWDEFEWCGREIRIGSEVVLRVNEPTIRCPSTRVRYDDPRGERASGGMEPDVGVRSAFPDLRASIFGRDTELRLKGSYLGVYASVIREGRVSEGDDVVLV
jgi:hypothetical protein